MKTNHKIILSILLLTFCFNSFSGIWGSTKKFFTKNPFGQAITAGVGFGVGTRIISGVIDYFTDDSAENAGHVQNSEVNLRIKEINEKLNEINPGLKNINLRIGGIEKRLDAIEKLQLDQVQLLQAQSLVLEKIQLEQMKQNVLSDVTKDIDSIFNSGSEEIEIFIKQQVEKIKNSNDDIEREHRLSVLHTVMLSALDEGKNLDIAQNEEFYDLVDLYQNEISSLNVKNINLYRDSARFQIVNSSKGVYENLNEKWSRVKMLVTSTNDLNLSEKERAVKLILDRKGNQKIRDLFEYIKEEMRNISSYDGALIAYDKLVSMLSEQSLTSEDYKKTIDLLNFYLSKISKNFEKNSPLMSDFRDKIKRSEEVLNRDVFVRDVKSPCLKYLESKIPGISPEFITNQVKLSYLKLAWAYADITNQNNLLVSNDIDKTKAQSNKYPEDKKLLLAYIKSNGLDDGFEKLIKLQQKRFSKKENKYLLGDIDNYVLNVSRDSKLKLSAHGLLQMINSAYTDKKYKGLSTKDIEKLIASVEEDLIENNVRIQKLLENENCQEYKDFLIQCKNINSKYSNLAVLSEINELKDSVTSVLDDSTFDLKSIELNNKKDVELKKYQKKKLEDEKREKALFEKKQRECEEKEAELVGDIVFVYSDKNLENYERFLQPGLKVLIDYSQSTSTKLRVRDTNRHTVGWIRRNSAFSKDIDGCLNP